MDGLLLFNSILKGRTCKDNSSRRKGEEVSIKVDHTGFRNGESLGLVSIFTSFSCFIALTPAKK
jgi:hypothetical protein